MESDTAKDIPWEEVIKKEARGIDDYDLGEVQYVLDQYVLTQKGIVERKWFEIPKELAQAFDGNKLIFRVSETEAKDTYLRDEPTPLDEGVEQSKTSVPLMEEKLEPAKKEIIEEATIIKDGKGN